MLHIAITTTRYCFVKLNLFSIILCIFTYLEYIDCEPVDIFFFRKTAISTICFSPYKMSIVSDYRTLLSLNDNRCR